MNSVDSDTVLPVLAGPTASGKTQLALQLAERHGLEIISADSRQIYRGLDIGTAKPTAEERARVRHHVIDVCDPHETYDLARFIAEAEAAMAGILARGKRPLVVGGTGLYIRGLTMGIFEESSSDPEERERLRRRAAQEGAPALHAELTATDPDAAAKIHPNDAVRIVRALEVFAVTGETITALQRRSRAEGPRRPRNLVVLDVETDTLSERIERRTREMFEAGLIEEVARLLDAGVDPAVAGFRAIGYPQALAALRGEMEVEQAIERVAVETRRFAKRQRTWFRAERDAQWIASGDGDIEKIVATLEKTLAIG